MLSVGILFGDQENPFWQEQVYWYNRLLPDFPFDAEQFFPAHPRDPESQASLLAELLECSFDALIINPLNGVTLARVLREKPQRRVVFDVGPKLVPELTAGMGKYVPLKITDFHQQGWMCAQELISHIVESGPFACISGPANARQSIGRVSGALDAASANNLETMPTICGDFTREGGRAAMSKLIDMKPCAVFCANDLMALGALDVLEQHGVKIPVGGVVTDRMINRRTSGAV